MMLERLINVGTVGVGFRKEQIKAITKDIIYTMSFVIALISCTFSW